jgi:hypothetical protein
MKNAHERFGVLEYTKRMKDTTTRIRLRLDRFIGEVESEGTCKAHLISVLGGDSDVGAIWAAVVDQDHFTLEAPGIDPLTTTLGEGAECFRGTVNIAGRKPIRHLVAVSAELAKTRPGMDPEGKRTILCDDDPTFMLYRIAQRFGLPVVPDWATWFNEELKRHGAITLLVGVGCSPVLVRGTKRLFLKWIGRGLRKNRIQFPEGNGSVRWTLSYSFFPVRDTELEDGNPQETTEENPTTLAEGEDTQSCESY